MHPECALLRKRSVSRKLFEHASEIAVSDSPNSVTLFRDGLILWIIVVERERSSRNFSLRNLKFSGSSDDKSVIRGESPPNGSPISCEKYTSDLLE